MARCDELPDNYPLGQHAPNHGEGKNEIQSIAQLIPPSSSKSAAQRFFAITELRQEMYRQLDSISLVRFLSVRKGPQYMYFAEVARVLYEELDWDDRDDLGADSPRRSLYSEAVRYVDASCIILRNDMLKEDFDIDMDIYDRPIAAQIEEKDILSIDALPVIVERVLAEFPLVLRIDLPEYVTVSREQVGGTFTVAIVRFARFIDTPFINFRPIRGVAFEPPCHLFDRLPGYSAEPSTRIYFDRPILESDDLPTKVQGPVRQIWHESWKEGPSLPSVRDLFSKLEAAEADLSQLCLLRMENCSPWNGAIFDDIIRRVTVGKVECLYLHTPMFFVESGHNHHLHQTVLDFPETFRTLSALRQLRVLHIGCVWHPDADHVAKAWRFDALTPTFSLRDLTIIFDVHPGRHAFNWSYQMSFLMAFGHGTGAEITYSALKNGDPAGIGGGKEGLDAVEAFHRLRFQRGYKLDLEVRDTEYLGIDQTRDIHDLAFDAHGRPIPLLQTYVDAASCFAAELPFDQQTELLASLVAVEQDMFPIFRFTRSRYALLQVFERFGYRQNDDGSIALGELKTPLRPDQLTRGPLFQRFVEYLNRINRDPVREYGPDIEPSKTT